MVLSTVKLWPPAGAEPVWHPAMAQLLCIIVFTAVNKGPAVVLPEPAPPVPLLLLLSLFLLQEKRKSKRLTKVAQRRRLLFMWWV